MCLELPVTTIQCCTLIRERAAMAEAHASGLQAANSKEQALESDALAKLARAEADERLATARELGSRVEELRAQLESAKDQCAAYERRLLHAEQAQADADCHARELSKEVRHHACVCGCRCHLGILHMCVDVNAAFCCGRDHDDDGILILFYQPWCRLCITHGRA